MANLRHFLFSTLSIALTSATIAQGTATATATNDNATAITAQKTFKIYHSLGLTKPFLPRGTITFSTESNVDTDGGTASNANINTVVENDESCLGENALQGMDELVSEGGFYRIKIVDEENDGKSVLASVPGCEVKRANFRYVCFVLIFDSQNHLSKKENISYFFFFHVTKQYKERKLQCP